VSSYRRKSQVAALELDRWGVALLLGPLLFIVSLSEFGDFFNGFSLPLRSLEAKEGCNEGTAG
jgi:hypothetical protein